MSFDRLLVAQALAEPLRLITHDRAVAAYSDSVILVCIGAQTGWLLARGPPCRIERTPRAATMPKSMETLAVIDFETTGISPAQGARATEIAAVLVQGGQVVGRFQSLMNTGAWVPPFIERFTGISNAMLAAAPPARAVMHELMRFTRGCPLVAHNAAFDRGFWLAEAALADCEPDEAHRFACTLLLSRRLYPQAANHRLGTLAALHRLPDHGRAHRALADALTTAQLLLRLQQDVAERFAPALAGRPVCHALLCEVQRAPRLHLERCLAARGPGG